MIENRKYYGNIQEKVHNSIQGNVWIENTGYKVYIQALHGYYVQNTLTFYGNYMK